MVFKYRLEKILELRESKLEEEKKRFQKQSMIMFGIQKKIADNQNEITVISSKLSEGNTMFFTSLYINRLASLKNKRERLEEELDEAKKKLEEIREEMIEAQQKVDILKRHKDKAKKNYEEQEMKKEQIELNELGLIMKRMKDEQQRQ